MKKVYFTLALVLMGSNFQAANAKGKSQLATHKESGGLSLQEQYSNTVDAYQKKKWAEVKKLATHILKETPESPFTSDLYYFRGVANYRLKEYEGANRDFSTFLNDHASPKFFEEAIKYKFEIAKQYEAGKRKHMMGMPGMPKLVLAKEDALEIYDEVISTLPRSEMAAESLYRKGVLQDQIGQSKKAIETLQTFIRRFPKHHLAPESYTYISKIYQKACEKDYPDPDQLELAEINLQNFARDFPSEPRVAEVESMVMKMRYRFAKELWDTAQFYERRKKTESALIYYRNIIAKYPSSHLARKAKRRLLELRPKFSHLAELFMDENDSPLIQEGVASVEEVAARDDEEPQAGDSNEDEPARDE